MKKPFSKFDKIFDELTLKQMERRIFSSKVIDVKFLNEYTVLLELEGKVEFEAGQFVMILQDEHLLARPFSIFKTSENSFFVLFKIFGRWTSDLVRKKSVEVFGPLGVGFRTAMEREGVDFQGKKLVVAGGVGIASVFPALDEFDGEKVVVFGGASAKDIVFKKEIESKAKLLVSTADGSEGKKGFVTDVLLDIDLSEFSVALACGPTPMLKALRKFWDDRKVQVPLFVAVEERMACGTGICFSCAVRTLDGMKLSCIDGPVFNIKKLLW